MHYENFWNIVCTTDKEIKALEQARRTSAGQDWKIGKMVFNFCLWQLELVICYYCWKNNQNAATSQHLTCEGKKVLTLPISGPRPLSPSPMKLDPNSLIKRGCVKAGNQKVQPGWAPFTCPSICELQKVNYVKNHTFSIENR